MNDATPRRSYNPRRLLRATVAAAGVALTVFGCSAGYDAAPLPAGITLQGDIDCAADSEPSQGDRCSKDCETATCASGMGRRYCTCEGGIFLQCACLPPANWPFKDVPSAPYCDSLTGEPRELNGETCFSEGSDCRSTSAPGTGCHCANKKWACDATTAVSAGAPTCESLGNGMQAVLKGDPCDTEWQLCIARDFNSTGTSPRGCACMMDTGQLEWKCGATNRWWRAE